MLTELRIENFAIIDQLELHFSEGLITFTGETGAGKSIIMDALDTLLGSRAETTQIRTEADRAIIEATFRIADTVRKPIHKILLREDLLDDPDYLTLGREIRRGGRNIARINGRSIGLTLMREIGEYLVDIHGQSEHLSLLRVPQHLHLLDRFADIEDLILPYKKTYKSLNNVKQELEILRQTEITAARHIDLLTYQINEIEAATLEPGEDLELKEEHSRLANAEVLTSIIQGSLQLLDDGVPENPTNTDLMGAIITSMETLSQIDASQTELHLRAQQIFEDIFDLTNKLRSYQETIEFNPNRLSIVEERITLINSLKRKYGETIEAIHSFRESAIQDLETITNADERILELEIEEENLLNQLSERGLILSEKRHGAAEHLQDALESELTELKMSRARIKVDFQQRADPAGVPLQDGRRVAYDSNGLDRVEFFIETNPGEGFKPLVKIASGGETSRFMLALKNVLSRADHVPTLVFDEIDQGIGGRVGSVVGQKLWQLSTQHQVMCITHLPQLAAFGQQHYQVEKAVKNNRTITKVEQLEGDRRIKEIALMLGEISSGTLQSAQEIMDNVKTITLSGKISNKTIISE